MATLIPPKTNAPVRNAVLEKDRPQKEPKLLVAPFYTDNEHEWEGEGEGRKKLGVREDVPTRHLPLRAHKTDAGLDLFTVEECFMTNGAITVFRTGVAVSIPEGHVGLICPRSGLAIGGITIVNAPGIIDAGYHGEIHVITTSVIRGIQNAPMPANTKIAQLVVVPLSALAVVEVTVDAFPESERGTSGFGSSGDSAPVGDDSEEETHA